MNTKFFESTGTLQYSKDWRLVLRVEQDLADYYRSLIPKWLPSQRPRWPAHVTVVRQEKETPANKEHWWKYNGHTLKFIYSPYIHHDKIYFWLNVWCKKLEEIRSELGLPFHSQFTLPPAGFKKNFHCTIANTKE
jgi:hypothetical protein